MANAKKPRPTMITLRFDQERDGEVLRQLRYAAWQKKVSVNRLAIDILSQAVPILDAAEEVATMRRDFVVAQKVEYYA